MPYVVIGARRARTEGDIKWAANPERPGQAQGVEDALTEYLNDMEAGGWTLSHVIRAEGDDLLVLHQAKPEEPREVPVIEKISHLGNV